MPKRFINRLPALKCKALQAGKSLIVNRKTNYKRLTTNNKPAFSLIELLIVIAIIGILGASSYAYFGNAQMKARDSKRKTDLAAISAAIEHYRYDQDNRSVPKCSSAGYCAVTGFGLTPNYIQSIPKDPLTKQDYWYQGYESNGTTDCATGSNNCYSYILVACLENKNGPKKDSSLNSNCTTASYTLKSPTIN